MWSRSFQGTGTIIMIVLLRRIQPVIGYTCQHRLVGLRATQCAVRRPITGNRIWRWASSQTASLEPPTSDGSCYSKNEKQQLAPKEGQDAETSQFLWEPLCDLQLPEGRCVGLTMRSFNPDDPDALTQEAISQNDSHWIYNHLHLEEVAFGLAQSSDAIRQSFYAGRLAIRQALGLQAGDGPPILKGQHGRPNMPRGFLGSISHKDNSGVGIVTRNDTCCAPGHPPKWGVGIDLEKTTTGRRSVAKRILTENEIRDLGRIEGITEDEEVLLRFSLKESIYKAVHPLLCQYIGFQEAEVTPYANGTATVYWDLRSSAHERLEGVSAHWRKLDGGEYFLSSSQAYLK